MSRPHDQDPAMTASGFRMIEMKTEYLEGVLSTFMERGQEVNAITRKSGIQFFNFKKEGWEWLK